MKITKQSAIIMPTLPHVEQIAEAAKVCYQQDTVKGDPEAFIKRIIARKHWSVLEMAVVTVGITLKTRKAALLLVAARSEFFKCTVIESDEGTTIIFMTASLRSWIEWAQSYVAFQLDLVLPLMKEVAATVPAIDIMGLAAVPSELPPSSMSRYDSTAVMPRSIVEQSSRSHFNKHLHVMVKFVTDRAIANQITRHRPCSFLQESQRFCRYSDERFGGEVEFIDPDMYYAPDSPEYALWERHCSLSEGLYLKLLKDGASPQAARKVLPQSTKTELICYANIEQWQHIFSLRADNKEAEIQIRGLMGPLKETFQERGWM